MRTLPREEPQSLHADPIILRVENIDLDQNSAMVGQFGVADISVDEGSRCRVRIEPRGWR